MSIFTSLPRPARLMLSIPSPIKKCYHTCQWLDNVVMHMYAHFDPSSIKKCCHTCQWMDNVVMHMYAHFDSSSIINAATYASGRTMLSCTCMHTLIPHPSKNAATLASGGTMLSCTCMHTLIPHPSKNAATYASGRTMLSCTCMHTLIPHPSKMLPHMPVVGQCCHAHVCTIWLKYTMWLKSYDQSH